MSFEFEKYLKAIKPVAKTVASYLPEIVLNWTEDEYQRFMQQERYVDLSGHVWPDQEGQQAADKNIRQEYGIENKSLDYNI